MAKYLSRRVKKTPQVAITSDRYQFLGLSQAEPDLGDPIVGPSSVLANPIPGNGVQYLLISYGEESGKRYWVPSDRLQNSGLIPGSFTVLNNGNQIGLANSFNKFNFVGVAVTVDPVGSNPEEQTGIATVRIEVIDVVGPGNPYEIPYHDPVSGYLRGSDSFVYYNNNVGIGSTLPTEKLEIIGNFIVSGNINSGGIVTAVDINSESLTTNDLNATGIATIVQAKIGVGETLVTVTQSGKVGIGSTDPQTLLDVSGDVKFNGAIRLSNGTGTVGQIIISNGSSPAEWGDFNEISVGVANSIPITNTSDPGIYYPTFTREYDQTASVYVDATSLVYDPSTNRLGIGSILPQYSLDVVGDGQFTGNIYAKDIITVTSSNQELIRNSSGIITTNSLDTIVIDSIGINTYRSGKYTIQITSEGGLGIGSITSVQNISVGNNYYPGIYSDVNLVNLSGLGTNAVATITVTPQYSLDIISSSSGIFTFTGSVSGITTGQTIYFNQQLDILPLEQSKLTEIQLVSSGYGYTGIPNITISNPLTLINPVPGVSLGEPATAKVTSMNVKDFNILVGVVTTLYPTVTISSPVTGIAATGSVGVGVSEISVVNVGSGYTQSPSITISKLTGFTATAGMGISSSNWQTSGGSGYTTPPTITIVPQGGIGTDAVIEADISADPPSGAINFTIVNPGYGYTVPPTVTLTGGGGVGAAVTIKEMIVTNVDVINIGSNATTPITNSDITVTGVNNIGSGAILSVNKIIPTNVDIVNAGSGYTAFDLPVTATFSDPSITATVGLGVEAITLLTTGIGYTTLPTITFSSPTLGISSVATANATTLGYGPDLIVYPGPSLGGTNYYINPINSNSFRISDVKNGDTRSLGYVIPSGTVASVGGFVSMVDITGSGSNYNVDNILTAVNFDSSRSDVNVGTGFSFQVKSVVNNFQISELLMMQTADSGITTSYVIESMGISDSVDLIEFSTDIFGDYARLKITPTYAYNTLKYYKTLFTI